MNEELKSLKWETLEKVSAVRKSFLTKTVQSVDCLASIEFVFKDGTILEVSVQMDDYGYAEGLSVEVEQKQPQAFKLTRQEQPPTLYLIRGIAGTGKTTLAEALTPWNCAADMMPGLYNSNDSYNQELQSQSHQWCQDMIEKWMKEGKSRIAVHNTFVLNQWIEPYKKLALQYGYRFQVIHCEGEHGSVHDVPEQLIRKWRETWEPYKN